MPPNSKNEPGGFHWFWLHITSKHVLRNMRLILTFSHSVASITTLGISPNSDRGKIFFRSPIVPAISNFEMKNAAKGAIGVSSPRYRKIMPLPMKSGSTLIRVYLRYMTRNSNHLALNWAISGILKPKHIQIGGWSDPYGAISVRSTASRLAVSFNKDRQTYTVSALEKTHCPTKSPVLWQTLPFSKRRAMTTLAVIAITYNTIWPGRIL